MKKTITIICCAVLGAAIAIGAAFLLIKYGDKLFPYVDCGSYTSETESIVSQPTDLPIEEITPTEYMTFTAPLYQSFTTNDASLTFKGNVKDGQELKLGNEVITCDENGDFEKTVTLKHGNNTFKFTVGEESKTFTVYRRYIIITSYTPSNAQTYSAGVKLNVLAKARAGATVTAKFNGQTITLTEKADANGGDSTFTGSFSLPSGHFVDRNLGKVTFTGVHNGWSESFSSGNITCKREDVVVDYDPDATPSGSNYINVGSGIICEIVAFQAETFNGNDTADKSRPYNNYLPEGTVDYSSATLRSVNSDGYTHQMVTLRCGKQVYVSKRRSPYKDFTAVTKQYVGTLPDHNELSVASFGIDGHHTTLVLDTDWKAPFTFELKDQAYNSNFTVNNVTFNYVDITFCYATVFEGEIIIPDNHPLFSNVKIIKNESDYTLRFILKKQGAFYGWDAYYNDQNQLCFDFLNPTQVTTAENEYGADLTGAVILIDVGHGGKTDTGTGGVGKTEDCEKKWNLILAKSIKSELESIGATVYITRTTDVEQLADYKVKMLKDLKPDYCIAIHHDGNSSSSLNGFGSYYYQPYSKAAAQIMQNHNSNLTVNGSKVYKNTSLKWHYYFMGRSSVCPVVLTENGYMTNTYDFNNIINMTVNNAKAKAITAGIAEYFLSIQ